MKEMLLANSIAVIGASDKKGKIGNILIENLKSDNRKRKIIPINPRHKIIGGLKVFASVLEVDFKIDLAILAIPAEYVLSVVEDCIEKKIKNIVIISAGFSESGKEGKQKETELIKLAQENNLNILGPNCLGFINVSENINASFAKKEINKGGVSLISQSGAFVTGLLDVAKDGQTGFAKIITLGNKAVLDEVDFLNYLEKDTKTKVIGLYLESIKRGRKFYNTLARVSLKKPVLILKAGNSEKVQKAIQSHTGSMAGENSVFKKVVQEAGGIYFENLSSYWNSLKILDSYKKIKNKKLVILTNAGGPGVISTDLIEQSRNINLYDFNQREKRQLQKKLPSAVSLENPIDILGDADVERYQDTLKNLTKNKNIGGILVLITPQAQTDVEGILELIKHVSAKAEIPIFPILIGSYRDGVFQFPCEIIKALNLINSEKGSRKGIKKEPPKFNVLAPAKVRVLAERAKLEKRRVFSYSEALELTNYYSINSLNAVTVDEKFKFSSQTGKLILKVDDPKILHKVAQGGVKTGIASQAELTKKMKELRRKFKKEKIIAQEQIEKGFEVIIGLKRDSVFGPVLLCGVGGILTEIIDEKILWILPIKKEDILKDLKNSKLGKIFEKEDLKLEELVEEVFKVGNIGWQNNWIQEFDINPMFFYKNKKSIAVDVKVKF
jgi:acetyltransferase